MFSHTRSSGFTLIELLVVIAIVGLLSSVVFASLNEAREKAAVVNVVSNIQEAEKALRLLADEEKVSSWWRETSFCPSNCNISIMATDSNRLGKYLSAAPLLPVGVNMHYDNDFDTFTCGDGGSVYRGVNIGVRGVSQEFAEKVSVVIDGNDDVLCGKVRWDPSVDGSLFYLISDNYQNY
jgi:prepilin-type N-terminal cleavage/methylation domain-containing protein